MTAQAIIIHVVPFHKKISPSGEQFEHRKLAHESEQPTAGCVAIFKSPQYTGGDFMFLYQFVRRRRRRRRFLSTR